MLEKIKENKSIFYVFAGYFCIHLFLTPQYNYLSLFFKRNGMTNNEIGLLMSIGPFVAIIAQFFWSNRADKATSINKILAIVMTGSAVSVALYLIFDGFFAYLAIIIIYNFFAAAIMMLYNSFSIYYASSKNIPFGQIRMMGSFAYLIIMVIAGAVVAVYIGGIFIIQLISSALFLLALKGTPKMRMPRLKKAAFNPMPLLRKPSVVVALVMLFIIYSFTNINNIFIAPYLVDELGAPTYYLTMGAVVSIIIEVIYLLNMDKILNKINLKTLFIIVGILSASRWLVCGITTNPVIVALTFSLQGVTAVSIFVAMSLYIKNIAPPEGKVSAQSLISIVAVGLSRTISAFLAPEFISFSGGIQGAHFNMFIMLAISVLLFAIIPIKFKTEDTDNNIEITEK